MVWVRSRVCKCYNSGRRVVRDTSACFEQESKEKKRLLSWRGIVVVNKPCKVAVGVEM